MKFGLFFLPALCYVSFNGFLNNGQSLKASSPIVFTDGGITTFFKAVHELIADFSIKETDVGIFISSKDEHLAKAQAPIEVTDGGISTFFNDEHPSKVKHSIEVTEEGIEISFKDLHSLKAFFPI